MERAEVNRILEQSPPAIAAARGGELAGVPVNAGSAPSWRRGRAGTVAAGNTCAGERKASVQWRQNFPGRRRPDEGLRRDAVAAEAGQTERPAKADCGLAAQGHRY